MAISLGKSKVALLLVQFAERAYTSLETTHRNKLAGGQQTLSISHPWTQPLLCTIAMLCWNQRAAIPFVLYRCPCGRDVCSRSFAIAFLLLFIDQ